MVRKKEGNDEDVIVGAEIGVEQGDALSLGDSTACRHDKGQGADLSSQPSQRAQPPHTLIFLLWDTFPIS